MADDQENSQTSDTGDSPAWAGVLEQIPPQFRDQVTPALQEWDKQYQDRYKEVENKYAAWQPFIQQNVNPDQIHSAWGLAQALEQDPVNTIKTIQEFYESQGLKFTPEQAVQAAVQQSQQQQGGELDPAIQARFDELKKQQDMMASVLVKSNEQKLAEQEDRKIAQEFDSLHKKMSTKYGKDFNEEFVAGLSLAKGVSLEQAAEAYYAEINQHVQGAMRPAPQVLGSGGGLPTNRPNVRQMTEEQLNQHAVDLVRNMRNRQT